MKSRNVPLGRIIIALLLPGTCLEASLPSGYDTIVISPNANDEVIQAGRDLALLLEREFGESPRLRRQRLVEWVPAIRIGPRPGHPEFDGNPLTDEILIERTRQGLWISGSDNTSTVFATYRFLQEFLGWRYYQPGPLGLEQVEPRPSPPAVVGAPDILLHEKAGYHSRNLGRIQQPAGAIDWGKWHGLRERFSFNHSVHRIITPDLFKAHKDWFAKDPDGNPMRPPYPVAHGYNDHPDLTHPGVRDHMFQWAIDELEKGTEKAPDIQSISLSLGDSFEFGNYPKDYRRKPDRYFRRWRDWSNHVFDFTNSLAVRINQHWSSMPKVDGKDRLYLGALAYLTWEAPPDFPVHPAVVPYLTYDRSQWYDPDARRDDLTNVVQWRSSGTELLATWDYLFGYGFLMPRSMTGIVSDSIPILYEEGVRGYFSQVAPIWPYDQHTTWLTARLLWDPQAETAAMLEAFYEAFYGPAAAPMRAFFELAEATWMNQEGSGWWLRYWKDPWQAALWKPSVISEMQGHLDSAFAISATGESRYSERVEQTRFLFSATVAMVAYENLAWRLQAGESDLGAEALRARKQLEKQTREAVRRYPLASRAGDLSWIYRYDNLGGALASAWREKPTEGNRQALEQWCSMEGYDGIPEPGPGRQILYDTRFTHAGNPRIWHRQVLDSENWKMQSDGNRYHALNVRRGHIYQLFQAKPGNFYLGETTVETNQSPSGEVYIRVDFFDSDNRLLSKSRRVRIAPTELAGEQQQLQVLAQAPEGTVRGRLFIRFYELDPDVPAHLRSCSVRDLGYRPNP